MRAASIRGGGALGETNSVAFMFDRVGAVAYPADAAGADDIFEAALEAGAQDVASTDEGHEITTAVADLHQVGEGPGRRFGPPERARLVWRPQNTVPDPAQAVASAFTPSDQRDAPHAPTAATGNQP